MLLLLFPSAGGTPTPRADPRGHAYAADTIMQAAYASDARVQDAGASDATHGSAGASDE